MAIESTAKNVYHIPFISSDFGQKKQRKKSRWSSETPDQKTVIPGMPTVIPPGLTRDQERAYIGNFLISKVAM